MHHLIIGKLQITELMTNTDVIYKLNIKLKFEKTKQKQKRKKKKKTKKQGKKKQKTRKILKELTPSLALLNLCSSVW